MNKSNVVVKSTNGTSSLVRPRFGPGMLLEHEDLEQMSSYTRELSRLMFRSLFGCGVVCGLVVNVEVKCGKLVITVDSGLALSCSGDPIHVPGTQRLEIDLSCEPETPHELWVLVCQTVKYCAPRTAACSCEDDEALTVRTRELVGYEIRVVRTPKCACGCVKEPPPKNGGTEESTHEHEEGVVEGASATEGEGQTGHESECWCADPNDPCYADHYLGKCDACADCGCDCVLLARLHRIPNDPPQWKEDHSVRRFIRPVLMRDQKTHEEKFLPPKPLKDTQQRTVLPAKVSGEKSGKKK